MKTPIFLVALAALPQNALANQSLGLDARERLTEVCQDEMQSVESYASLGEIEHFWMHAELQPDAEFLHLESLETRASFGVFILDTYALSSIEDEVGMQPEYLENAIRYAEKSKRLVECAMTQLGGSNVNTTKLFLGWLQCHKPLHDNLAEQYWNAGLNRDEFARIVNEAREKHASCRELPI